MTTKSNLSEINYLVFGSLQSMFIYVSISLCQFKLQSMLIHWSQFKLTQCKKKLISDNFDFHFFSSFQISIVFNFSIDFPVKSYNLSHSSHWQLRVTLWFQFSHLQLALLSSHVFWIRTWTRSVVPQSTGVFCHWERDVWPMLGPASPPHVSGRRS